MSFILLCAALLACHYIKWNAVETLDSRIAHILERLHQRIPGRHKDIVFSVIAVVTPLLILAIVKTLLLVNNLDAIYWLMTLVFLVAVLKIDQVSGLIQSLQLLEKESQWSDLKEPVKLLISQLRKAPEIAPENPQEHLFYARHALIYSWFVFTFMTLFAYAVAGLYGALFTLMISAIYRHRGLLGDVIDIVEWIPARVLGLSFVLLGNSYGSFSVWINSIKQPLTRSDQMLGQLADAVCNLNPNPQQTLKIMSKNLQNIDQLIARAGIFWLIILGVINITLLVS